MKWRLAASALILAALSAGPARGAQQDEMAIWKEFVTLLRSDTLTVERIRPAESMTAASQLALLREFAKNAAWEEWDSPPRVVHYGNLVTFLTTLGRKQNSPWTYTFNFLVEDGRWYYRFLEGVVLPFDKLTALPAAGSDLPDLPEERKAWVRNELYWSQMVRYYTEIAAIKGKPHALALFRDGAGYALAATVWIPFYPTPRAFVLYLCWEQARLQGNTVTLEKLTDREAVVRFDDNLYFALYERTSHLKTQIPRDDYVQIFETIWQDRARAAGWTLKIDGQGRQIYLRFTR